MFGLIAFYSVVHLFIALVFYFGASYLFSLFGISEAHIIPLSIVCGLTGAISCHAAVIADSNI